MVMAAVSSLIVFGGPAELFSVFVLAVLLVAAWEWGNLCGFNARPVRVIYCASLFIFALALMVLAGAEESRYLDALLSAACVWWAIALLWVQSYPTSAVLWGRSWTRALMGAFVLIPPCIAVIQLRQFEYGPFIICAVVMLVAAADIGAYFTGRSLGKRKLAPRVSPGKSWEGVLGGMVAAVLLACLFTAISQRSDYLIAIAIALPTALASVLGDLVESMVKRHRGVKDSGTILPGHGGVLDRIDGITSAAPVFTLALLTSGWSF